MFEIYTVAFFGHRYIDNIMKVENLLEEQIRKLIDENEYVDFLVGRNGDFDQCVSSSVLRVRKNHRDDNSALVLVLPYPTAEFRDNEGAFRDYYDEIEICEASAAGYFKNAHQTRNREMVERSDLVVFCIQHESGGAWQTMKYAKKQGVPYININEPREDVE